MGRLTLLNILVLEGRGDVKVARTDCELVKSGPLAGHDDAF